MTEADLVDRYTTAVFWYFARLILCQPGLAELHDWQMRVVSRNLRIQHRYTEMMLDAIFEQAAQSVPRTRAELRRLIVNTQPSTAPVDRK